MRTYKTLSDNELTDLLKEGDHAAYTEIYNRYFYLLYHHAYKKLKDGDTARDVIQDLFTTLWFKKEFLDIRNLSAFLFVSVRNRIFQIYAHEQVKGKYLESLSAYSEMQMSTPTDYLVREKEMQAYIEREIQRLPAKMRRIFEMSRKEHLSHKEIAEKTGTSENNVSTQVTSALRLLKGKLGLILYFYFLIGLR